MVSTQEFSSLYPSSQTFFPDICLLIDYAFLCQFQKIRKQKKVFDVVFRKSDMINLMFCVESHLFPPVRAAAPRKCSLIKYPPLLGNRPCAFKRNFFSPSRNLVNFQYLFVYLLHLLFSGLVHLQVVMSQQVNVIPSIFIHYLVFHYYYAIV